MDKVGLLSQSPNSNIVTWWLLSISRLCNLASLYRFISTLLLSHKTFLEENACLKSHNDQEFSQFILPSSIGCTNNVNSIWQLCIHVYSSVCSYIWGTYTTVSTADTVSWVTVLCMLKLFVYYIHMVWKSVDRWIDIRMVNQWVDHIKLKGWFFL
jgi:hypothetical protein